MLERVRSFAVVVILAFAADGSWAQQIAVWGINRSGGEPMLPENLTEVVEVVASGAAFVARGSNGELVAWGQDSLGG